MFFMRNKGWYCQFLEEDLKTPLPRKFTFASGTCSDPLLLRYVRALARIG
jgi:hypothetical protein